MDEALCGRQEEFHVVHETEQFGAVLGAQIDSAILQFPPLYDTAIAVCLQQFQEPQQGLIAAKGAVLERRYGSRA